MRSFLLLYNRGNYRHGAYRDAWPSNLEMDSGLDRLDRIHIRGLSRCARCSEHTDELLST